MAGYRVGGKTGTSQKLDSEDSAARIASFAAVAPIEDPKIAVLICLDEPHSWTTSGGALAGPVAAAVLEQALPHLGIAPSFTAEEQETLFAVVPNVTGWRTGAARQALAAAGFDAALVGEANACRANTRRPGSRRAKVPLFRWIPPAAMTRLRMCNVLPSGAAGRQFS